MRLSSGALASSIALVTMAAAGCDSAVSRDTRPSVVLVVLDTVRASAVSAYGDVAGTTPTLDALAAEGLLYLDVTAPSPWTLPSHASLLTGIGVDEHRVGMPGRVSLEESAVTLAERLHDAGYDTAAFSENMLISDPFHLLQGFAHKRTSRVVTKSQGAALDHFSKIDVLVQLRRWLDRRESGRPFFVFVNLLDAHDPFEVRDENPWVPPATTRERMSRYAEEPKLRLCRAVPPAEDLDILRGLYHGDVRETDEKLGRVLETIRNRGGAGPLITIVTSDHGELFGDHDLLGHEFAVRRGVLEIPLVVHGLSEPPAVIDSPVTLVDVVPSTLAWVGLEVPSGLAGQLLPTTPEAAPNAGRFIVSAYTDSWPTSNPELEAIKAFSNREKPRSECGPEDKVRGGMIALSQWPYRFYWFEHYAPELYDLRWDEREASDLATQLPDVVSQLTDALEPFARRAGLWPSEPGEVETQPTLEEIESLRALGYLDG